MTRRTWWLISVAADAVAINLGLVAAFVIRFGWPVPSFNFAAYERTFIPVTLAQLFIFYLVDLYEPAAERSGPRLFGTVLKGLSLGLLALLSVSFFFRAFSYPRTVIVLGFVLQLLLLYGWRRLTARSVAVQWPERRVLVVGGQEDALAVAERLARLHRWGYRLVGVFIDETSADGAVRARVQAEVRERLEAVGLESSEGAARVGLGLADLVPYMEASAPDQVILASPAHHRHVLEDLTVAGFRGEILVVPQFYEVHLGELDFSLLEDMPLLSVTRPGQTQWREGSKRLAEVLAALALLVVLSPLLLLLALAVLLTSGRPVLYRQVRLGRELAPFTMYKFRTMIPDAENGVAVLAEEDDPRVTWLGRWLRRSRMDELPQLYNVLRGEMSFVGPRPERPEFVEEFVRRDPLYRERFRVRPGITGLAQVSGSYATTADIKLRFDMMYIHHQSLGLDLRIVGRTVRVVLTGRGAA